MATQTRDIPRDKLFLNDYLMAIMLKKELFIIENNQEPDYLQMGRIRRQARIETYQRHEYFNNYFGGYVW